MAPKIKQKGRPCTSILISTALNLVLVIAAILFLPGLPPNVTFESYKITPPLKLEGPLAPNGILDKAEIYVENQFIGPESIAQRGDEIYTGVVGGQILRIREGGQITPIAKFGTDCDGYWEPEECGRPLGMRFDDKGKLVVADAYYGIFRVDVDTGNVETLVSSKVSINGKKPGIPDDLDVSKDGTIYWSDASTSCTLEKMMIESLGSPTGRLLKYSPSSNESVVLIDKLHFANGVQLSKNEDFVLVAETVRSRVWKYHLKGPKKGEREIFVDGLPGLPDNIRSNGRGGFYISLILYRDLKNPLPFDILGTLPLIRKLVLRVQGLISGTLGFMEQYIPLSLIGKAQYYVDHLGPAMDPAAFGKKVVIVECDENGNFIGSLQTSTEGKVYLVTEVSVGEKYTYFGSFVSPALWRIKTSDLRN